MAHVNPHYLSMPGSYLFSDIAKRVAAFQAVNPKADLIRLGIGDVTRPLAPAVIKALHEATDEMGKAETFKGYGPECGYPFLIDAIREYEYESLGVTLEPDEVIIGDGAKSDTANIQELFAANSVVAVPDPVYPVYVDSNAMAGRAGTYVDGRYEKLVYLPARAENGFVPELPKGRVDMIYLCFPNNPTGSVLNKAQLKVWVDYCLDEGAILLFDAAYRAFITEDGVPRSIYEVEGAKKVAIEFGSLSKTAGFTGLRCSYTVVPKAVCGFTPKGQRVSLNEMWQRRTSTKFNGAPYIVQRAAAAVFTPEGQAQVKETIAYYLKNAALIRKALEGLGFEVSGGVNAPYIWFKTPDGMDSWHYFDELLTKAQVVGTPGAGFGPSGEGYFRLTAFNTYENTVRALERLAGMKG